MSSRVVLATCFAIVAPLVAMAAPSPPAFPTKPHILHVIVDDFGWGALSLSSSAAAAADPRSLAGNTNYHRATPTPEIKTPAMDALVGEGVEFMRHYVHPEW